MVTVADKKQDALCDAVNNQTKLQQDDMKIRQMLRIIQLETLQSAEADRQVNRLIILRDEGSLDDEEFKSLVKASAKI